MKDDAGSGCLVFFCIRKDWTSVPIMGRWVATREDFRDKLGYLREHAIGLARWKYGLNGSYPILMDGEFPDEEVTEIPDIESTC